MGKRKEALELITRELRDVGQAIEFCKEHNDEELWDDLINYSIDKPCTSLFILFSVFLLSACELLCLHFDRMIRVILFG